MDYILLLLFVGSSRQGVAFEQIQFADMENCVVAMRHFETVQSVRAWCVDRKTGAVEK